MIAPLTAKTLGRRFDRWLIRAVALAVTVAVSKTVAEMFPVVAAFEGQATAQCSKQASQVGGLLARRQRPLGDG